MTNTIDILLATFNGSKYLREQLNSILGQSYHNWRLIIRDDCSKDDTLAIIEEYCTKHPDKIILIDHCCQNIGVVKNFSLLLDNAIADYIMFCDQDDVWLPHKISITLEKMLELESTFGREMPLLAYTDLTVVDESGDNILADSVWKYQQLDPVNAGKLNRVLLQNIPTGCTVMINRALRKKASPIPEDAAMHDWWLTLVAVVFGTCGYVPEATVLYRQHGMNVCGAEKWSLRNDFINFLSPTFRRELKLSRQKKMATYRRQAAAFILRYSPELPTQILTMIHTFTILDSFSKIRQKYYILKYRFFYNNGFVTAAMILFRW